MNVSGLRITDKASIGLVDLMRPSLIPHYATHPEVVRTSLRGFRSLDTVQFVAAALLSCRAREHEDRLFGG